MDNQAIYYFHQGTNYCAYEYLGAHRTPAGMLFSAFGRPTRRL